MTLHLRPQSGTLKVLLSLSYRSSEHEGFPDDSLFLDQLGPFEGHDLLPRHFLSTST